MIINNENFKVIGIIGSPLRQSMSPLLHNYWIKKHKLNSIYLPFPIKTLKNLDQAIKTFNILGLNVTIPYKSKAIKCLDAIEKKANIIGAVNTLVYKNKKIKGFNTDIYGFGVSLERSNWEKKNPIFVFGSGGAAEAVISYIYSQGCKDITIVNRTKSKSKKIANKYVGIKLKKYNEKINFKEAGLIVNTTSLGMIGYPELNIDLKGINNKAIIYDIVYNPIETGLIKKAIKEKIHYITGLDMFIEQARKSFEIWFSIKPKADKELKELIKNEIKKK